MSLIYHPSSIKTINRTPTWVVYIYLTLLIRFRIHRPTGSCARVWEKAGSHTVTLRSSPRDLDCTVATSLPSNAFYFRPGVVRDGKSLAWSSKNWPRQTGIAFSFHLPLLQSRRPARLSLVFVLLLVRIFLFLDRRLGWRLLSLNPTMVMHRLPDVRCAEKVLKQPSLTSLAQLIHDSSWTRGAPKLVRLPHHVEYGWLNITTSISYTT